MGLWVRIPLTLLRKQVPTEQQPTESTVYGWLWQRHRFRCRVRVPFSNLLCKAAGRDSLIFRLWSFVTVSALSRILSRFRHGLAGRQLHNLKK